MPYIQGRTPARFSTFTATLRARHQRSSREFQRIHHVCAYADDLALACRGRKTEDVALRMQAEVDKVVSWSQQARLTLNAAKCEVAFFSLDNAEAQWRPQIIINAVPPSSNPSPTFLGVTYDRRMTFGTQVKKVCLQMLRRTNLLRVVGGTTWGWQEQDLRTVYIDTQRSVAE